MDVRMAGVEVRNGDPFERRAQVLLHSTEEIAREAAEIRPFAEFRRDDQLEKPLVACPLPGAQRLGDVDPVYASGEAGFPRNRFFRCALTRDVPAVSSPLAADSIGRVRNPHRATLEVWSSALVA